MRLASLVWGAALCSYAGAFIVPDQLVSLLTVVYSVIPPIKKGSDSRVGFGYRFGPFADFQVLLELGPQSETQPIGGQSSGGKRQTAAPPPPPPPADVLLDVPEPPQSSGLGDDADPGKRPDIQLLDATVAAPAARAGSRSARSRPSPSAAAAPVAPPAPATDWLSRWRSSLGAPPPSATPAANPAPPAPEASSRSYRVVADPRSGRPRSVRAPAATATATGFPRQQQRRWPSEARWEAMQRLRSLWSTAY